MIKNVEPSASEKALLRPPEREAREHQDRGVDSGDESRKRLEWFHPGKLRRPLHGVRAGDEVRHEERGEHHDFRTDEDRHPEHGRIHPSEW
jgi:hypothetical protein